MLRDAARCCVLLSCKQKQRRPNALNYTLHVSDADDPAEHSELIVVGRSNAGKSSLLNALWRQEGLAPCSKTPGRTQSFDMYTTPKVRARIARARRAWIRQCLSLRALLRPELI